jgi:hypothetical protein
MKLQNWILRGGDLLGRCGYASKTLSLTMVIIGNKGMPALYCNVMDGMRRYSKYEEIQAG